MPRILLNLCKTSSAKCCFCDTDTHMDHNKLIEIETSLAHQEQQITELNAVITDQWAEIDRLKRLLNKALAKIDQIGHGDESDGGDGLSSIEKARQNIPPHH